MITSNEQVLRQISREAKKTNQHNMKKGQRNNKVSEQVK